MLAYDQLLHLSNRRKYEYELQRAIDIENNVGILFLDLDRFKYINDSLGHRVGDKLIVSVAKRLKDLIDNDTIVLRQGGDEFTILVKGIGKDNISKLAKDILDHMKKPFIIDQHEILITCSIGISLYPEHGKDIETLMKNADAA
ncbi:GGDEF domain-containing protein, partial [Schinkia azotoformans]